ncbi:Type IIS restriction enzyme Eco57I [Planctomycetes bacterium Pan216]|uniref:site-specific DNA-methyltransferase (adenine-specific) n=1 Tax=Kolteria novifilia TaxID=2527975 RepID=A0A518B8V1_9BACT|nr:Type IIS restriction enzyme Eco57I [Planctomycetes bacterium Pan216]
MDHAVLAWTDHLARLAEEQAGREGASDTLTPERIARESLASAYDVVVGLVDDLPAERLGAIATLQQRHPLTPRLLIESYEHLLDRRPIIEAGRFRLLPPTERETLDRPRRKASGSYFTPEALVAELIDAALAPVVRGRVAQVLGTKDGELLPAVDRWTSSDRQRAADALLRTSVLDPACGSGAFLLAAGEFLAGQLVLIRGDVSTEAHREARREVACRCLAGIDLDALALHVARRALWIWVEKPDGTPEELAPHLVAGDALALADPSGDDAEERELHHWFETRGSLFDVVLGNPPFANAIEESGFAKESKERLGANFPELTGTADLAFYFLALAHRLTAADGAIGLVLPRGVLTSRASRALRERLLEERPPVLVHAPQDQSLFRGANVFVVLLALRRNGGPCLGSRDTLHPRLECVVITSVNWWAPLVDAETEAHSSKPRVGDLFEVFASMTTGMAYDVLPFVRDEPRDGALRLVTTGLIDPGVCHWGERVCRYLKHRFECPVIHEDEGFPATVAARLAKVRRPKVLVAGLSLRVEAFFDRKGSHAGAVSTFTILDPEDDRGKLAALVAMLNEDEATRRLVSELGAHAMGGGRMTLNKDFLRYLPFGPS